MPFRSIPPRTMSAGSRDLRARRGGVLPVGSSLARASLGAGRSDGTAVQVTPVKKPRHWQYQTRPSFKRGRGPLVAVFDEGGAGREVRGPPPPPHHHPSGG